ncbi:MAG TPA: hypothetical protein VML19_05645 [Verrucomicrobiae bacterium]|nr:hypothetical protein [Verrucomicrobiae bacterium]
MANITDIERLNYYEGEYLGAVDFEAEQEYHRDMRRRHSVGQHTWGIVGGLDLAQIPNGGPNNEVDVNLMPGMAVDGFGREIVVLAQSQLTQDAFAAYFDPNPSAAPKFMYVWIAYDQSMTQTSQQACTSANQANAFARVLESYRIAVTPTPTAPPSDPVVVDGASLSPPPEGTSTPPPPSPGGLVLPYDGSVPYQEFADDDTTVTWFVPIGRVKWDPHNEVFLQLDPASAAIGRLYAGNVSSSILAPAGALTIENRAAPYPLPASPADPNYGGVSAEIAGSLQVDRLLNPLTQVLVGATFNPSDNTPLSPLTITAAGADEELIQFRDPSGQETWRICENADGANPGVNISEFVKGKPVDARLFIQATLTSAAPSLQNVGIGTMTPRNPLGIRGQGASEELLSFEDANGNTRWHLNQNLQGSLPNGTKFTRGLNFAETGVSDYRLFLQSGGNVGIGTPLPQQNLSVNGGLNIDQADQNGGQLNPGHGLTFGNSSGEGIASNRSGGANQFGLDFFTASAVRLSVTQQGRVGIGTNVPDAQLTLTGGQWDLTNTPGDLKIGNAQMMLKFGVALGGAGAGDARVRAQGGTSRLMLGSGVNDTLTLQGANVGINNITPAQALEVNGNVHITGWMWAEGGKFGYVADRFIYRGSQPLERGDIVVLHSAPAGGSYGVTSRVPLIEVDLTTTPLDTHVCGIVDEPVLSDAQIADLDRSQIGSAKVGLMVTLGAYMFCKVDASSAAIQPGDLLSTSAVKGYAQRIGPRKTGPSGAIIGKALAGQAEGRGVIPVLVSHQ